MKNYKYLEILLEDGIGNIVFNRPEKLNSLNSTMVQEICEAINQLNSLEEIKCLILTGKGRGFCAGWDVQEMGDGTKREIDAVANDMEAVKKLVKTIVSSPKIIISVINGIASGGGCGIVLASDFAIANENAKFSFPFINVGFIPDTGISYFLPKILGLHKAKEILLFGQTLTAQQAKELGFVNVVVNAEDMSKTVKDLAANVVSRSQMALTLTKKLLNSQFEDLNKSIELESTSQTILTQTKEHLEFVAKFLEKNRRNK